MADEKEERAEEERLDPKVKGIKTVLTELLDEYFDDLGQKFPNVKKGGEVAQNVRDSILEMMEHLDVDTLKAGAEKDLRDAGSRLSQGSGSPEDAEHGVLPPQGRMLVVLAKLQDEGRAFSAQTFSDLLTELQPVIQAHGEATARQVVEDTLMMLYNFFAGKLSDVLVPKILDVLSDTVFPDVRMNVEIEKLTRYLVDAALGMVPKAVKGKDIKAESADVAKKFTAKASTVLAKTNAPPDVKVNEKNVEKMFDIIIQLGHDLVFRVMRDEKEAKELIVPVLKDVIKLVADSIPENLL